MAENPLLEELRDLARQVAAGPEDVAELGADIAAMYRRERMIVLGLAAVDSMVNGGPEEISEDDPRLHAVRERMRHRLRAILEWARKSGRM